MLIVLNMFFAGTLTGLDLSWTADTQRFSLSHILYILCHHWSTEMILEETFVLQLSKNQAASGVYRAKKCQCKQRDY